MATPPHKSEPISILKAPPQPRLAHALPSPSSPNHVVHIAMSEDEDDEDLKYVMSDGEDDEPGYIPSGRALELLQTEKACYSGYLLKKGEKRRTWKKRWFVLRTTKLAMYKDKKEYKLLRIIDLHDIHSVVQVTSKNKYRNVFAIITPKRMYYVQADDQQSMEGWFDAIDQAKEQLRLYDPDDNSHLAGRDQEFAKDVITSYKSSSSSMTRRRSSATAGTTVETRRHSSGGGGLVTSPSIASSSGSTSFSQSPPIPNAGGLSSDMPSTATTTAPTKNNISTIKTKRSAPVDIPRLQTPSSLSSSPLSDYATGHVYPLSPTYDQAQVHFAEGIASSDDDEDYSLSNSIMDVKKEEDRNRVLVEGYLLKLGRNKGWQKRWFVLRTDTLAYYENDKEYSPHRIIPLEHIIDTLEIDAISKNKQYCFKIIIPKRNYVLCASTEDNLEDWLNALSVAVWRSRKDNKERKTKPAPLSQAPQAPHSTSATTGGSTALSDTSLKSVLHHHPHHHPHHHQAMRLEQINESEPSLVNTKPSMESFENPSHLSGASAVGGAGGALGRH